MTDQEKLQRVREQVADLVCLVYGDETYLEIAKEILSLPDIGVISDEQPNARVLLWHETVDADRQGAWIELPAKEAGFVRLIKKEK